MAEKDVVPFGNGMTPIEVIVDNLDPALIAEDIGSVGSVFVPEQCCIVTIGDRAFHLTITEVTGE